MSFSCRGRQRTGRIARKEVYMTNSREKQNGRNLVRIILPLLLLTAFFAVTVFAEGDVSEAAEAAEEAGRFYKTIWSLLPPVIAITLALATKEVYTSLFVGIMPSMHKPPDTAHTVAGVIPFDKKGKAASGTDEKEKRQWRGLSRRGAGRRGGAGADAAP